MKRSKQALIDTNHHRKTMFYQSKLCPIVFVRLISFFSLLSTLLLYSFFSPFSWENSSISHPIPSLSMQENKEMPSNDTNQNQTKEMPSNDTNQNQTKEMPSNDTNQNQTKEMPSNDMNEKQTYFEDWKKQGEKAEKNGNLSLAYQCYAWALQYQEDQQTRTKYNNIEGILQDQVQKYEEKTTLFQQAILYEQKEQYEDALLIYQKLKDVKKISFCEILVARKKTSQKIFSQIQNQIEKGDWENAILTSRLFWKEYETLNKTYDGDPFFISFAHEKKIHEVLWAFEYVLKTLWSQRRYAVLWKEVKKMPEFISTTGILQKLRGLIEQDMVLIPSSSFIMGCDHEEIDEFPQHTKHVNSFYIGKYEVSLQEYMNFIYHTNHKSPDYKLSDLSKIPRNLPVVGVSWQDACDYAEWMGFRLPTEIEWEKAARGTLGYTYPWGNDFDSTLCNSVSLQKGNVVAVDSFPNGCSPYGCFQMAGNVLEWTSSLYEPYENHSGKFPLRIGYRVARGGSWLYKEKSLRCSNRYPFSQDVKLPDLGFRCVWDSKE